MDFREWILRIEHTRVENDGFLPSQCPPLCGPLANSFERVSLKPAALRDQVLPGVEDLERPPDRLLGQRRGSRNR